MKAGVQKQYAEYIAKMYRGYRAETGRNVPDDACICANYWSPLGELDDILGTKILHADVPTSFDFWFVMNAPDERSKSFLRWSKEYMSINPWEVSK